MDYADKASIAETNTRNMSLSALKRLAAKHNLGMSASNCRNCGEEIPEARRKAQPDCEYCIACQAQHERQEAT